MTASLTLYRVKRDTTLGVAFYPISTLRVSRPHATCHLPLFLGPVIFVTNNSDRTH